MRSRAKKPSPPPFCLSSARPQPDRHGDRLQPPGGRGRPAHPSRRLGRPGRPPGRLPLPARLSHPAGGVDGFQGRQQEALRWRSPGVYKAAAPILALCTSPSIACKARACTSGWRCRAGGDRAAAYPQGAVPRGGAAPVVCCLHAAGKTGARGGSGEWGGAGRGWGRSGRQTASPATELVSPVPLIGTVGQSQIDRARSASIAWEARCAAGASCHPAVLPLAA